MENKIIREFLQHRPVDEVEIRAAVQKMLEQLEALQIATTPNYQNKVLYAGKIEEYLFRDAVCECGEVIHFNEKRKVPWNVIQDVLSMVQKRAQALK